MLFHGLAEIGDGTINVAFGPEGRPTPVARIRVVWRLLSRLGGVIHRDRFAEVAQGILVAALGIVAAPSSYKAVHIGWI